jgi:hypothetical protein
MDMEYVLKQIINCEVFVRDNWARSQTSGLLSSTSMPGEYRIGDFLVKDHEILEIKFSKIPGDDDLMINIIISVLD